jgi:uncharacterized protein YndB with AHSA1/START domain
MGTPWDETPDVASLPERSTVRSDRRYPFAAAPDALWDALSRTEDYRSWWPWLRGLEGADLRTGARWRCEVQPPLPYSLRFDLHIEEVEAPRFVTATVTGDIVGHAAIDVSGTPGGSELRLVATLAPASTMLRAVARVAHPLVRFGHDWVIDTGLRQFHAKALTDPSR